MITQGMRFNYLEMLSAVSIKTLVEAKAHPLNNRRHLGPKAYGSVFN